ncbi:hypothetical protein ACP26L_06960 [Paenibacillus sp. S-38]|uniref:hypothetical protein n=1 Tax=Paenibacillus sp. S-38 TaxID=3416710 RepID=UPI003CF738D8
MKLISWKFDDKISGSREEWNWVEITLFLEDGSKRWSIVYTPERLHNNLSRPDINPPGIHIPHLIIVRSYEVEDIETMLRYLEREGDLLSASRAY